MNMTAKNIRKQMKKMPKSANKSFKKFRRMFVKKNKKGKGAAVIGGVAIGVAVLAGIALLVATIMKRDAAEELYDDAD